MKIRYPLSAIFAVLTLFACSDSPPSAPMCRFVDQPALDSATAAGCIVRVNNAVLMVRHRMTGRLDIPGGGRKNNEPLACTAHRETFEETGLNVEVGSAIGKTTNGMILFECAEQANLTDLPLSFNPLGWSKAEVSELVIANLYNLSEDDLRYHDDLVPLRDAFTKTQVSNEKQQD